MAYRPPAPRLPRTVEFTVAEIAFLNSIKPWSKDKWDKSFGTAAEHNSRNEIKDEIKRQLEIIQDNYCAYCGLDLRLAYEVHKEHIAPQYKHPHYIFEPRNLILACNFCNMHKKKKKTVNTDTRNYDTEVFRILHPHKDDFCDFLTCDFIAGDLVFSILEKDPLKTQNTIDCVGLNAPHLIAQRGAIIIRSAYNRLGNLDTQIKEISSQNRRGR
ncbi:MAG: retron system putative HNH endonuclease [Salinivirgaceae bacterium]